MSTDNLNLRISRGVLSFIRLALSHIRVAEKRFEDSLSLLVCDDEERERGRERGKGERGKEDEKRGGEKRERGEGEGERENSLFSLLLRIRMGMVHIRMEQYDVASKRLQKTLKDFFGFSSFGNGSNYAEMTWREDEMTWQNMMTLSAVDHICSFFEIFDDFFIEEFALKLLWRWDLVAEEMTWASESIKGVRDNRDDFF